MQENRLRFHYHWQNLSASQKTVLELLPILLHVRGSSLASALKEDSSYGIAGYEPTHGELEKAQKHFHGIPLQGPELHTIFKPQPSFEFLYLMGSAGTIGFAPGSDMDFWLGIEKPRFSAKELASLEKRIAWIERWADHNHQTEIHLFITDIEELRQDQFGHVGGESCGSAMGSLLKDELYRSMIHIAGKYPKYWATPHGIDEKSYKKINFPHSSTNKQAKTIDIGHVRSFKPQELFGAILWQILKGFHSPFKSVIKIALLYQYAQGEQNSFLCERIKEKIHAGHEGRTDPYVEMMDLVKKQKDRTPLLFQCFFIKCIDHLDGTAKSNKLQELQVLTQKWGIPLEFLNRVSAYANWNKQEKQALSQAILTYFIETYKSLRDKALQVEGSISGQDLTILGKTLKAYLQQDPLKIPIQLSGMEHGKFHLLHVQKDRDMENREFWSVASEQGGEPIYRHTSLLHLGAWLIVNRCIYPNQKYTLHSNTQYSLEYWIDFLRQFDTHIPKTTPLELVEKYWQERTLPIRIFVVPNPTSNRVTQQIQSLLVFSLNSIGELWTKEYVGESSLEELTREQILGNPFLQEQDIAVLRPIPGSLAEALSLRLRMLCRKLRAQDLITPTETRQ